MGARLTGQSRPTEHLPTLPFARTCTKGRYCVRALHRGNTCPIPHEEPPEFRHKHTTASSLNCARRLQEHALSAHTLCKYNPFRRQCTLDILHLNTCVVYWCTVCLRCLLHFLTTKATQDLFQRRDCVTFRVYLLRKFKSLMH